MRCEEVRLLIDGYLDGELALERTLEFELHLQSCTECAPIKQRALALRSAIQDDVPYFRAPHRLEQRVRMIAVEERSAEPRISSQPWRRWAVAAVLVLVVLGLARLERNWLGPPHEDLIAQEIAAGHIRSLMANHLSDVVSTDQHTVKPWFDGKLDFAPPVLDLAQAGFPLAGGRLDYIDSRPVAALVYQRRLHYINLFIWPSTEGQASASAVQIYDGYNLLHWTRDGMTFWAISDVSGSELQTFASLLQK